MTRSGVRCVAAGLAAACALGLASGAAAQDADDQVTEVAPVTIQGAELREVIGGFVSGVSAVHERNGQLARFHQSICPGVMNLNPEHAQVIIDRIARVVHRVGMEAGRPGCEANVLVIFTEDSDRLAVGMVEEFGRTFDGQVAYFERGNELLEEFQRPGRPVRWWHMAERAEVPGGDGNSRLRAAYHTELFRVLIVVDTRRVGPVNVAALGDYVAMHALARLSPDWDTVGHDTILNLFELEGAARPTAMSTWDQAYLEALYSIRSDFVSGAMQENHVAYEMTRRFRREEERRRAAEQSGEE